ncbi:MAG: hypothetical protein IT304_10360 [Dehalococcoidia bacterium]|nr:hypothetical protein [Dehalococcoidia bacterium]
MLSPLDDLLVHQAPYSFATVTSNDPNWTEKTWFTIENVETGDLLIDCGIGQYPNRNVQDAFAGVSYKGRQYNVRMSRALHPDFHVMKVGPFSVEILEGLRKLRLVLDDNPSGVSFDITWNATLQPHEETHHFDRIHGRITHDIDRYAQMGRASGILRIPGETFRLEERTWYAQRDHSWGNRPFIGNDTPVVAEAPPPAPAFFNWCPAQFDSYGLFWYVTETSPGIYSYFSGGVCKPVVGSDCEDRVVGLRHDFRWAKGAPILTLDSADVDLILAGGSERHLTIEALPARYFLRAGLYGGYRGWWHGHYRGPSYFEHDVWDLRDEATLAEAGVFGDHVARFRCGDDVGYGIIEYGVGKGYPRYPEAQG